MQREQRGFFHHTEANVPEGQRYAYRLNNGPERPDPCSLWQPDSVHDPSAVVLPERFSWTDAPGAACLATIWSFYELHVGTFTPEGTFEAIIPRLNDLRELGMTAAGADAGRSVSRRPELGLRWRTSLRRAE